MSSLPSWWGASLPCGCVRGVRLCAEAVSLWDAVADAHKVLADAISIRITLNLPIVRDREQRAYDNALAAFNAHVEIAAEPAVQAPML